jgi:hypothetical protein
MRHFSKRLHSYINHLLNAPSRPGRALLTCNFLSSSISAAIKNHARPSRRISDWSLLTPKARGIAARSKIPSLLPHAFAHLLRGQDRKLSGRLHTHPSRFTLFFTSGKRPRATAATSHCRDCSDSFRTSSQVSHYPIRACFDNFPQVGRVRARPQRLPHLSQRALILHTFPTDRL